MTQNNFDTKQKINSFIAFSFIMLLGLALSWFSIKAGEEILANMPDSEIVNINKRMENENSREKIEVKNTAQDSQAVRRGEIQK
jgi:hypothetical protein